MIDDLMPSMPRVIAPSDSSIDHSDVAVLFVVWHPLQPHGTWKCSSG